MTTALSRTIAKIDRHVEIGTILHLGAGEGAEFEVFSATSAKRIVLVEPDPDLLPALKSAADDPRVTLIPVAVGAAAGEAEFFQASFANLSSLHTPAAPLKRLFPGLEFTESQQVETMPLPAILDRAAIDASMANILIIDAPGAEAQIVQDLCAVAPPSPFTHVVMRAGIEPMYDGTAELKALVATLEKHGYRVAAQDDSDPDFPWLHLRLEPLRQKVEELRQQLTEEREQLQHWKAKTTEAQERAADLELELERARSRLRQVENELVAAGAQMEIVRELMRLPGGAAEDRP